MGDRGEKKRNYFLRVLKEAKFKKLKECIDIACSRSGMSRLTCLKDMIHCTRKFGSGYHDYVIFHFYEMDDDMRATYMTRLKNKKLLNHANDPQYEHIFEDKCEFAEVFRDFTGRSSIDVSNASKEEILAYFREHDEIFGKIANSQCSYGAELMKKEQFQSEEDFYEYVKEKDLGILEEVVKNHHAIRDIYPHALNTTRMITLIGDDGKPHLLYAAQKFGDGGRFVDVFGLHGPVNMETGVVEFPFHSGDTIKGIYYWEHPYTKKPLIGFKLPYFKEAKEMILKAAGVVPQVGYVGWDVAITENGPLIIEGNPYGAYEFMQLPGQNDSGKGILEDIEKIVSGIF